MDLYTDAIYTRTEKNKGTTCPRVEGTTTASCLGNCFAQAVHLTNSYTGMEAYMQNLNQGDLHKDSISSTGLGEVLEGEERKEASLLFT